MKPKSLLGFLVVVALAIGAYVVLKPHYESEYHKGNGHLPPKEVVVTVPDPISGT